MRSDEALASVEVRTAMCAEIRRDARVSMFAHALRVSRDTSDTNTNKQVRERIIVVERSTVTQTVTSSPTRNQARSAERA